MGYNAINQLSTIHTRYCRDATYKEISRISYIPCDYECRLDTRGNLLALDPLF